MPNTPDGFPWADLGRWFAGEMSPDEAAKLERWIADDPERAPVVASLREAWTSAGSGGEGWDAATAIRRVHEAAEAEARVIARLGSSRPAVPWTRRSFISHGLRAAAVAAFVAGSTFIAERAIRRAEAPALVTTAEYRTTWGQRLALRLSDGTQVMLAPGSVLRRPSDYGQRERRLELEGQGYFVVTHDSTRPFTVRTSRLVAHDLGTRFDVRAYPDESSSDVMVAEGRVEVHGGQPVQVDSTTARTPGKRIALLSAGQLARLNAEDVLSVRSGVDLARHLAWTEGRLVFRDTPLRYVERQLERWYDVRVHLASADLGRLRVTGAFDDEPVTQVLDAVARSLGLVVRSGDGGFELSRHPS